MTDSERIKRLETAVERLCDIIKHGPSHPDVYRNNYELIRQYVRGDLEQNRA